MGEFLRARITPEMAAQLEKMVKETKEKAPIADVSMASIARHALDECITEYENKKTHKEFRFKTSNMKSLENLEQAWKAISKLALMAELDENKELYNFYKTLSRKIGDEVSYTKELKRLKEELKKLSEKKD